MPTQVSILCNSATHSCQYTKPSLVEVSSPPMVVNNLMRRKLSAPLRENIAERLMREARCGSCIVLTSLNNTNCSCREEMHVMDMASSAGGCEGRALCHHCSEPLVKLALDDNNAVISNTPSRDTRATCSLTKKHFPVLNIMIVPLFVGKLSDARRVGCVILANREPNTDHKSGCDGFTVDDYLALHNIFSELAIQMFISFYETELTLTRAAIESERRQHLSDMATLSRSRDTFIATMSHEIRTPLNAVNGYNEIMSSNKGSLDIANCLRRQREAIYQLTQLIANILDFTKLKSDSLKLESQAFQLRDCIQRVADICMADCVAKHLTLKIDIDESVPQTLIGDSVRVYQIIMNLLSNAIKYTSQGGFIYITVASMPVDRGLTEVRISVKDTGRGIPAALQDRIFEEFHQIRDVISTPTASVQGVGLGLAICKELVRLMRGKIWVESDGHSGSTFTFTCTLRDSGSVDKMLKDVKVTLGGAPVLIVDDKEVNRMLLTQMFVAWGFRPHTCSSVDEAVHTVETFAPDYFKIAIVDIDISGESGLSLVRTISQNANLRKMLLIAVSSMGSQFVGYEEFDAVHVKPLHAEDILADIQRLSESGPIRKFSINPLLTRGVNRRLRRHGVILIVDDDAPSREVTKEMIVNIGYAAKYVLTSTGANEAMRILRDRVGDVKCVFMDLVMPGIDGIECTKLIRQDPTQYGTPYIVALTADAVDLTRVSVMQAGADTFVSKPVSMCTLEDILKHAVSKKPVVWQKKKVRRVDGKK